MVINVMKKIKHDKDERVMCRVLLQLCMGLSDIMAFDDRKARHSENWGREFQAEVNKNGEQQLKGWEGALM